MISKDELLFEQWVASLQERDRTKNAVKGNFESLFISLKKEGLSAESAYQYLSRATKAHQPNASLIKNVYKKLKVVGATPNISEKEFQDSWNKDIADKAQSSFFEVFPVEEKPQELEEPAVYGSMTAKEYKAQRSHADQYPRLDIEELRRRMQNATYDPMQDLNILLGQKSGNLK